jgi:hypothetical protein
MTSTALLPLLVTTLVAGVSWYVAHAFAKQRDRANKRRELLVGYLIDAYRKLEVGAARVMTIAQAEAMETAIADIQLFGSRRQVELVQEFARDIAETGGASIDALLIALRADLREELGLVDVPARLQYLRFDKTSLNGSREPKNSAIPTPNTVPTVPGA